MNEALSSKRIDSLQALRGIAFLAIFSAHAGITRLGAFGVSIFLVLSGFVLTYSYDLKESYEKADIGEAFRFMFSRIKRLYPLHLVMLLISLPFQNDVSILKMIGICASNVFLLQTWIPTPAFYFSLNSVSWFLSVCVFLYIIFPFAFRKIHGMRKRQILAYGSGIGLTITVCSLLVWILLPDRNKGLINYVTYIFPVFRLGDFLMGCLMGELYKVRASERERKSVMRLVFYSGIEVITVVILIFIQSIRGSQLSWWTEAAVYLPVSLCLVYSFALKNGVITRNLGRVRSLILLGNISGYTFLIHWVVIHYVNLLAEKCTRCENTIVIVAVISLIITVLLSWLYGSIRERVQNYGKKSI